MVDPKDIPRIVVDAVRLVRAGEIVVFGSSALAFWLESPPQTRDVDIWCDPPDQDSIDRFEQGVRLLKELIAGEP